MLQSEYLAVKIGFDKAGNEPCKGGVGGQVRTAEDSTFFGRPRPHRLGDLRARLEAIEHAEQQDGRIGSESTAQGDTNVRQAKRFSLRVAWGGVGENQIEH